MTPVINPCVGPNSIPARKQGIYRKLTFTDGMGFIAKILSTTASAEKSAA